MGLTWIAIIASLLMGSGAVLIFVWAVRRNLFRDFEDVKYQVFWSDLQDLVNRKDPTGKEPQDGHAVKYHRTPGRTG